MANEKRLIDANALADKVDESKYNNPHPQGMGRVNHRNEHDHFLRMIMDAPTVDAVPVVHGRWEQVQRWATKAKYRCSVCGRQIMSAVRVNSEKYPYCHCGAYMRERSEGE